MLWSRSGSCCEGSSAWPAPSGERSSSARQRRLWNNPKAVGRRGSIGWRLPLLGTRRRAVVDLAAAEVTDGLLQGAVVQRHLWGALRDAPGAAGAARTVPCAAFRLVGAPRPRGLRGTHATSWMSGRRRCCVYTQASWATSSWANSHCWRHCSGLMSVASRLGTRPSAGS